MPTGASATSSRVTVPVAAVPPGTLVGLTVRDARSLAGFRISVEDSVVPANAAVIVTGVGIATGLVKIWNVAAVAPGSTVTLAGTVATALSLPSATVAPSLGAATSRTRVPVAAFPPIRAAGATVREKGGACSWVAVQSTGLPIAPT